FYFGTLIPTWFSRRDALARGLGLGCLAGTMAVFLQSLVEFPLRMPANALYVSAIMGLGWVVIQPQTSNNSTQHSALVASLSRLTRLVIFTLALAGISLSAVAGVADLLDRSGEGLVTRAIDATARLSSSKSDAIDATTQKTLLVQASSAYQRAQAIEPWQPAHTFRLGRAYESSATTLPPLS